MSEQDDIFDLEDFVAEKGDASIKAAWKDHMAYFIQCEEESAKLRELLRGVGILKGLIKEYGL